MVVAAVVAAFILGLLCAAVLLKRFSRHFPADQEIGKTVLHMTRHAGFKDFVAVAFIAGIFLCALIGGALWYYFPRVEVVTQQVPVDRVVTKEVVREVPVPAPANPAPKTAPTSFTARCTHEGYKWDQSSQSCIYDSATNHCRASYYPWNDGCVSCVDSNGYDLCKAYTMRNASSTNAPSHECPTDAFWSTDLAACISCAPGKRLIHFSSGPQCVDSP
jgi:hypothetical protein